MDNEQLKTIISNHVLWLGGNPKGEKANLRGADLQEADLRGADLRGANLQRVDLRGADLQRVDLWGANLWEANLRGANLFRANLQRVDLRRADLQRADLWDAIGNAREVKSSQLGVYSVVYTKKIIQIGCERHLIEDWKNFSDEEIDKMDSQALKWWSKWKDTLFQIIEISPAWG